jgi:hypothetical protein
MFNIENMAGYRSLESTGLPGNAPQIRAYLSGDHDSQEKNPGSSAIVRDFCYGIGQKGQAG